MVIIIWGGWRAARIIQPITACRRGGEELCRVSSEFFLFMKVMVPAFVYFLGLIVELHLQNGLWPTLYARPTDDLANLNT